MSAADLGSLLAEQNSPVEVVVFLAVTVALFLVIALALYVLIMALLRPGLPKEIRLRRVLLPSASQLRDHVGDYALAVTTSLLLSLTLVAKHDLVEQISSYDMASIPADEVAVLFDFGVAPDLAARLAGATLDEVVQPVLAAGKTEEASLLVRSVIAKVKTTSPKPWLTPRNLVIACSVMGVLYLAWLARRRFRTLRERPDSEPEYATTFRSLLTLGLCVGLLLGSGLPIAEGGESLLGQSALAAIAHDHALNGTASPVSGEIRVELMRQRERAKALYCPTCDPPGASIWEVVENGSVGTAELTARVRAQKAAAEAVEAALRAELDATRERLGALSAESEGLRSQLAILETAGARRDLRLRDLDTTAREAAACCVLRKREMDELATRHARDHGLVDGRIDELGQRLRGMQRGLGEQEDRQDQLQRTMAQRNTALDRKIAELERRLSEIQREVSGVEECCSERGDNEIRQEMPVQ